MLNPSVIDLLAGVADALAATVADELPSGPQRDQVRAAVAIIRRVARALPTLAPALQEDTQALAAGLRDLAALAGPLTGAAVARTEVADALAVADSLPDTPLPSLDQLMAANLVLRAELAGLAERPDLTPTVDAALRDQLAALASREAALRLSPWER